MSSNKVILAVRKLASDFPDYVYPATDVCRYTAQGNTPSCLFGQALFSLSYTHEQLEKLDEADGTSIKTALHDLNIDMPKEEVDWCELVQSYQDSGTAWGTCIELADEELIN